MNGRRGWREVAVAWAVVAAWAGIVLSASSEVFSAAETREWVAWPLGLLFGDLDPRSLDVIHMIVRKVAHFVEYGVLGGLSFRACRVTWPAAPVGTWAWRAFGLALLCAAVDETHQTFVPGRTGSVVDVGIDVLGAWVVIRSVLWHHRG